jgi:hypothetical protein
MRAIRAPKPRRGFAAQPKAYEVCDQRRAVVGLVIGKPLAQIVQQHIRVRPDPQKALLGLNHQPVSDEFRCAARCAACVMKHLFAPQNAGRIDIPAPRHAEIASVEAHQIQCSPMRLMRRAPPPPPWAAGRQSA